MGVGNSTNKKDAQANAARDMVNYLVRLGHIKQNDVPGMVGTVFYAVALFNAILRLRNNSALI